MSPPLRLRIAEPADAADFAAIYAPIVRDTAISFETDPPTAEVMEGRVRKLLQTHPWLAAERDGRVIGYCHAGPHRERAAYRWSVDVTPYVHADARGQGVGRALYLALIAILRLQGFRSAFAGIALPNPGSVGLHEALGFELLGVYRDVGFKHGRWRDVGWWRLSLSDGEGPPGEPVPFEAVRGSGEVKAILA